LSVYNQASLKSVIRQILELVQTGQLSSGAAEPLLRTLSEYQGGSGATNTQPIAVIGIGGAFPGAHDIPSFWQALDSGFDAVQEIPLTRWDWHSVFDEQPRAGKSYSYWAGFLEQVDEFDPLFFNISHREALAMDPQQRWFLRAAWHALQDGGYADSGVTRQRCGVFAGCRDGDYRNLLGAAKLDSYGAIGCDMAILSARIAYLLDLAGPAITIDSACSSSLTAVALACNSLQSGLYDVALAGGVSVLCTPDLHISLAQTGMLSRSGRCRSFDAQADGFVPAEGAGVVLLKPLTAAIADGDNIYAVIEAWGLNQDGRTNGITAPSGAAQAALLVETYRRFGISPETIGYVETHGTGTQLGDPIELESLNTAFRQFTDRSQFCAIGSVKSNIGHTLAASGIAGLIKTIGSLRSRKLFPSLHFQQGNPHYNLSDTPFWVNTESRDWEAPAGQPRRAAVSSFGFSGTNVHIVLREPSSRPLPVAVEPWLFPFSARNVAALQEEMRQFADWLPQKQPNLANLSYTLLNGRGMFEERALLVAASHQELTAAITGWLQGMRSTDLPTDARQWLAGDRTALMKRQEELRKQGAIRIAAPLYPFQNQSFWPTNSRVEFPEVALLVEEDTPFLTDHIIQGCPTVPGVVSLCLAMQGLPPGYWLRDVVWTRPLVWSGEAIRLTLQWSGQGDGRQEFMLASPQGMHSTGRAYQPDAGFTPPERVDLEGIRSRLSAPLSSSVVYERFSQMGFAYGPTLRSIAALQSGSTEALALLRRPESERGAPGPFPFSVGMLDGALQTLLGLTISDAKWAPVPFSLSEIALHRSVGEQCYAWLRLTGQGENWLRFDIDLLDEAGLELVQFRGLTVRPLLEKETGHATSIETLLIQELAREVGLDESQISPQENFSRYGIDSMMVLNITRRLEAKFGELPKTLFFEFQTIMELAEHLAQQFPDALGSGTEEPLALPITSLQESHNEPIAIVGISGRFPESANLDEFWANLRAGRDCIREIPQERWDHDPYFDPRRSIPGKTWSRWGGFLDDVKSFDPLLFRISPREAEIMDPQERLFLEVVWETIENAGYTPAALAGRSIGVYAGAMYTHYQLYSAESGVLDTPLALNSSQAAIANRVSYFFDLHGPSIGLDTMCSSSLTAIHLACDALRRGEIEAAIAGGVNLTLHPQKYLILSQANVASSDGRCRSFGEGGDGYVPGEGVGAVLLKPLSRAVFDGDTIHGLIRGSAVNHGGRTNGFTVPSVTSQAEVIRRCIQQAKVNPGRISYVEAHGTGTVLGDPIELAALSRAFTDSTPSRSPCAIGSVKSNIGHLESAAGMASITKVLLQMRHHELVPSLHAETLNPNLDLEHCHFILQRHLAEWHAPLGEPRLAGVSSFGAGGSNAHVLLEEFVAEALLELPGAHLLPLSARTMELLRELCVRMADFAERCDQGSEPNPPRLADVAFTLQSGRTAFETRMVVVASSFAEWSQGLRAWLEGDRVGSQHEVLRRWISGEEVDWATGRPAGAFRRVPLPNSPLLREQCWPVAVTLSGTTLRLEVNQTWLDQHVVQGRKLMPAAALLELFCSSTRPRNTRTKWRDIRWLQPIFADNQPLTLELTRSGNPEEQGFRLLHDGTPVTTARLDRGDVTGSPWVDLVAIRERLVRTRSVEVHYRNCEEAGLQYGDSFRVVEELRTGSGEALATLRFRGSREKLLPLEPTLLDGGLQAISAIEGCWNPGDAPLPAALGELIIFAPLPALVVAHATLVTTEPLTFQLELCAPSGEVCVRLGDLQVQQRRTKSFAVTTSRGVTLYTRRWLPAAPAATQPIPERVILCGQELALPGVRQTKVFQPPTDLTAARALVAEWAQGSFTTEPIIFACPENGERIGDGIHSFFPLIRALLEQRPKQRRELFFFHPADDRGAEPRHAAVAGFARTLAQENPHLVCRVVEYPKGLLGSILARELTLVSPSGAELAYRDGQRLSLATVPLVDAQARPLPLRQQGVYLISGGHGGIGFAIAEFLAKEYAARLILLGRSVPDAASQARLARLESYGAEVVALQADVADPVQTERVVQQALARFGRIDGLIHSAGVLRDGFLLNKSLEDFQAVLAPKVAGIQNLLQALTGQNLAFVALFSSLAAVIGNSGQADYAYANAFLDHLATWRGSAPIVSINWPYWRDGGMRLSERAQEQMIAHTGLLPLETKQGLDAFCWALTSAEPVVLVAAGERTRLDELFAVHREVPGTTSSMSSIASSVLVTVGQVLKLSPDRIRTDQTLSDYGMDSVAALQIASQLEDEFGPQPDTLLFEYGTVDAVARYLTGTLASSIEPKIAAPLPDTADPDDIAIIGLAGRYPYAESLSALWDNLVAGRDCITEIPPERWHLSAWYGGSTPQTGLMQSKWGSFLSDVDCFDPRFFGITPREAELIDPQERLFLEVAWQAIEDAALTRQALAGRSVGVFVGAMWSHYQLFGEAALKQGRPLPASSFSSLANRLSYFGNFQGPSLTVDTMCSSSLTAIHLAAESLRRHECDTAVAGAVNLSLHPHKYVLLSQGNFVSPTGRCRSFGPGADGYVPGEGAGAVVLKRLTDAIADGDPIRAVLKASAINHGGRSAGYSVPNSQSQAALLHQAWQRAGETNPLTYIEAHGTGTSLGDPLEIAGLRQAMQELGATSPCRIGSIKSNLGHLEAAAGIAGLTKVVLQLEHRQLVPSLHADPPSSKLDFGGLPLQIQTKLEAWSAPEGSKRRAGVSSFGAGGSNAHLVVEEYIAPSPAPSENEPQVVVLSARTPESLGSMALALAEFLEQVQPSLADLSWTLKTGREAWEERAAFVATNLQEAIARLRELQHSGKVSGGFRGRAQRLSQTISTPMPLVQLAEQWTAGATIAWEQQQQASGARRISLPGYRFARERYWIVNEQVVPAAAPVQTAITDRLRELLAQVAGLRPDEIDPESNFADLGLDSILQGELVAALEKEIGALPASLLWEYPNLRTLTAHLESIEPATPAVTPEPTLAPVPTDDAIAIVGLHGRYPGVVDLDAFWEILRDGHSQIGSVPPDRWPRNANRELYCHLGAFLEDADQFDPMLFGISPVEAAQINPEERLLLESAWACLEDAGYSRQSWRGCSVGVFIGATTNTYPLVAAESWSIAGIAAPDTATYSLANRISYTMDWQGPSLTIDTACSSSLVAIHMACESIRRGECEAALAGSVNLYLHPAKYVRMCQGRLLARELPDGLFARGAEGFVPGEGVGSVLLKPLAAALRDGDVIHGLIRSSTVRHKGRSNGFLAPSAGAQQVLVREALTRAGLEPPDIQYLELQATGAAGTDALEIDSLREVFDRAMLGSLKPNIGHLEATSGLAALTKILLQMRHRTIAPVRLARERHPEIRLTERALWVPEQPSSWTTLDDAPLRAGLGSFGAGGVNAYLIIEEPPVRPLRVPEGGEQLIVLSAPTETQLNRVQEQLATYLDRHPDTSLAALAWTLQSGREEFAERAAIVVPDVPTLRRALSEASLIRGRAAKVPLPETYYSQRDWQSTLTLWLQGVQIEWRRLQGDTVPVRLSLPHYPFERIRCWIEAPLRDKVAAYYDTTASAVDGEPLLLTFAPFPERVAGFHWLAAMANAAKHPEWQELIRQRQIEMRQVAFRHVQWPDVRRILDIGCGMGTDLVRLLSQHPHLSADGFTVSAMQSVAARRQLEQAHLSDRCQIHHANSATDPFPLTYDLIFGFEVTFHIHEKEALFANIAAHLEPGGCLVLIDCVATTLTSLHMPHLGQFTSNEAEWAETLSAQGLRLTSAINLSPQVANFLYGPDFETHLQALSTYSEAFRQTEAEHRGWHRFGQTLEQGLVRYMILEIRPDSATPVAVLRDENLRQLSNPESYVAPAADAVTLDRITEIAAGVLQIPPERLDVDQPFGEYGLNSLIGLRLLEQINRELGTRLEMPLLYSAPTLRVLSQHVPRNLLQPVQATPVSVPTRTEPIAVIGMAGRFPGARNVTEFWRNLAAGHDAVSEVPADRWNWREHFDTNPERVGHTYCRWGGFLDGMTEFDAPFFRITPAEAEVMDPQQRLFLETCWHALDDAGYAGEQVRGARCGVIAGVLESDFGQRLDRSANPTRVAQGMLGNAPSILAARIAYFLNLKGPAVSLNTACSSSLVAIHLACQSLRHQETDLMLAGGVSLYLDEGSFVLMSKAGMLSPTGRCRTFDASADGIVVGEAVGVVVLKRLADAQRDGDPIYGIIEGSGINQDGTTNGLTAPNGEAQRDLETEVLQLTGRSAADISYIECHGTGTRLGDPIEVQAIREAYRGVERCALGSVKSNIGHTSAAAGVVSLIKVLLAMRHGQVPPTLHVEQLNPLLGLEGSAFYINRELQLWQPNGTQRVAAINSFGYSGTNAHLIVAEPAAIAPANEPGPFLIPLSARDDKGLRRLARQLAEHLAQGEPATEAQSRVCKILAEILALPETEVDGETPFVELGWDAYQLAVAARQLTREFSVAISSAELLAAGNVTGLVARLQPRRVVGDVGAIAATFQCDRMPMPVRAVCLATSAQDLYEQLLILSEQGRAPVETENNALAQAWVSGQTIDWRQMYRQERGGVPLRRERLLPPYPFTPHKFPLPPRVSTTSEVRHLWRVDDRLLQDHKIKNEAIMPGVMSLAAAVTTVRRKHPEQKIASLEKFVWLAPIRESVLEVRLNAVTQSEAGVQLVIEGDRVCAQGLVRFGEPAEWADESYPLESWRELASAYVPHEEFYRRFAEAGLSYGESLRVVQGLFTGENGLLSRIVLPGGAEHAPERFLEGAFQTVLGSFEADTADTYLPFSLEACQWNEQLPATGYAWVVRRAEANTPTFDLWLLDDAGQGIGFLSGLCLRESPRLTVPTCYAETVWQARPLLGSPAEAKERWYLGGFSARERQAVESAAGSLTEWLGDLQTARPDRVIQRMPEPIEEIFYKLLELAQTLTARYVGEQISVILAVPCRGEESPSPLHAAARSLRLEYSALLCRVVEIDFEVSGWEALLLAEARQGNADDFAVRYEQSERLVLQLRECSVPSAASVQEPSTTRRTWLITGATGGLGGLTVQYLAATGSVNLVLTGRSQPNKELLDSLQGPDVAVSYCRADLTEVSEVAHLVAHARREFGQIHGWVHAAGVTQPSRLQDKTRSAVASVLRVKVTGTILLNEALREEPLERILLFSSIAGVLGDFGQPDYAFANAFLDAFASQHPGLAVAIRWPLCAGGQMQVPVATREFLRQSFGLEPLPNDVFRTVLSQALLNRSPHIMPLTGEMARLRRLFSSAQEALEKKDLDPMPIDTLVEEALIEALSEVTHLAVAEIDLRTDLREYGLDSIAFTELANRLNARFPVTVTPTIFFECANLKTVADAMRRMLPHSATPTRPQPRRILVPQPQVPTVALQDEAIAIIGMAGRFPGAETIEEFWQQLAAGTDLIREVPAARWTWQQTGQVDEAHPPNWGGFLTDVAGFDAAFFGISPREAALMDPQQRLFLETVWSVIEDAGYPPSALAGTATGIFVGVANMDYANLMAQSGMPVEPHATTGVSHAMLANRVSYLFDLHGPSEPIDTACSSALIAVHRAIEAIRSGSCDQAIAGGVNVLLSEDLFVSFSKAGMLSPGGRCRTFDAAADGYVRGEGVGAVFLKPLAKAIADGDQILAVVRASGQSHNGRATGLTAPNGAGQTELLVKTYRQAGIDPASISYVEAHGTATQIGDPVEYNALREAFEQLARERKQVLPPGAFCGLGSVKSNIGHLETAAGIAGLQKVILALQHRYLPPTLHVQQVNPYLQLENSPFYIVTQGREWVARPGQPRRAGVSSFGFGGANAHVVVEEAPVLPPDLVSPGPYLFVLSARQEERLRAAAVRLSAHVERGMDASDLTRLAFTLQTGRELFEYRLAMVARSASELAAQLQSFAEGRTNSENVFSGVVNENSSAPLVLLAETESRDFMRALCQNGKLDQLARLWVAGAVVDWRALYSGSLPRRVSAPSYPFDRKRHWFSDLRRESTPVAEPVPTSAVRRLKLKPIAARPEHPSPPPLVETPSPSPSLGDASVAVAQRAEIRAAIREQIARVLFLSQDHVAENRPFVEMGLDSILAVELVRFLNRQYGIDIKASRLFDCPTVDTLANYIAEMVALNRETGSVPVLRREMIRDRLTMHLLEIRE